MRRLAAFLCALLCAMIAALAPAESSAATLENARTVAAHAVATQAAIRNVVAKNSAATNPQATSPEATATGTASRQHTVLILTGGLRWDQLDHSRAPYLSQLAASGIAGNLVPISVRGATCPIDSWLAMSAGRKVSQRSMASSATCPQERVFGGTRIPEYRRVTHAIAKQGRSARLGFFANALYSAGIDVHPIGTGAAYALTDRNGFIPFGYEPAPARSGELAAAVAQSAAEHELTIVDADKESYATDAERIAAQAELEQWAHDQEAAGRDPDDENAGHMPADIVDGTELDPQRQSVAALNIVRLERILAALPAGTRVLVASIVGLDTTPYMQIVTAATVAGPGPAGPSAAPLVPSVAYSESVRQPGIIQLADLDPTLLSWFAASDLAPTGTAMRPASPVANPCDVNETCYTDRVGTLIDKAKHAGQIQTSRGTFIRLWTWGGVAYFAASLLLLAGPVYRRSLARRRLALAWSWLGLTISAVPLAAFVLNMFPWWDSSHARLALLGGGWGLAGLLGLAALAARRLHEAGPLLAVSATTAFALGLDAATGAHAIADSPIGFNLLTGARFYGVGNEAYSLIAAGSLLALAFLGVWIRDGTAGEAGGSGDAGSVRIGVATDSAPATDTAPVVGSAPAADGTDSARPPRRDADASLGRRLAAVAVVGSIGSTIAAVDALPRLGADFGGVLSFVPALAVLLLFLGQVRLTWRRASAIAVATVAIAAGVALADWMRPPAARTHLGRFVQSVADGELFDVLGRKLATNLRLLTSTTYRWVVLAAVLLAALALLRALMRRPEPLAGFTGGPVRATWAFLWGHLAPREGEATSIGSRLPALRPALVTVAACFVFAFALNDSGIVLPGVAALLLVPGIVALVLEGQGRREQAPALPGGLWPLRGAATGFPGGIPRVRAPHLTSPRALWPRQSAMMNRAETGMEGCPSGRRRRS